MLPVSTAPEARRRTCVGPEDAAEQARDDPAQALLTAWPSPDKAQARSRHSAAPCQSGTLQTRQRSPCCSAWPPPDRAQARPQPAAAPCQSVGARGARLGMREARRSGRC